MEWVHHLWIGHCAVVFTSPPWTSNRRDQRARRSSTGWLVLMENLHCEWGERGRRLSGSSLEANGGGAMTVVSRRQRAEAAVRGAWWADARARNVVWRRCSRAAFIGRGMIGGGGHGVTGGGSVELQWRSRFGWGRIWGGETESQGDERGSGADSFCHGRGRGAAQGR
jgi:hypothetical protein